MPRPVVPIFAVPRRASLALSKAACTGRISAALSEITRLSGPIATPCPRSRVISLTRWNGSITTPLPITDSLPGRTIPDGSSEKLVFNPVNHQRMAGIMTTLKAHDNISPFREPINDFALAFIPIARRLLRHLPCLPYPLTKRKPNPAPLVCPQWRRQ